MSIKRYFSQVDTSKDQSPHKKLKASKPTDLPSLDSELIPLLDLSSPSLSSHASIAQHFDKLAEHLFERSYLVCCSTKSDGSLKSVLYEFLEFEFYMIKLGCHPDPYTHDEAEQRLPGVWLVYCPPPHCLILNSNWLGTSIVFPDSKVKVPRVIVVALGKDSI